MNYIPGSLMQGLYTPWIGLTLCGITSDRTHALMTIYFVEYDPARIMDIYLSKYSNGILYE